MNKKQVEDQIQFIQDSIDVLELTIENMEQLKSIQNMPDSFHDAIIRLKTSVDSLNATILELQSYIYR